MRQWRQCRCYRPNFFLTKMPWISTLLRQWRCCRLLLPLKMLWILTPRRRRRCYRAVAFRGLRLRGTFSVYPTLEVNEVGLRTLLVARAVSFVCRDDILFVFCLAIFVLFCFMEQEFVSFCLAILSSDFCLQLSSYYPTLKSNVLLGSDCCLWYFVTYSKTFVHAS